MDTSPSPERDGNSQLRLRLVTVEGEALSTSADLIEIPTDDGEIGVYPGHIPLAVALGAGQLRAVTKTGTKVFVVAGGFARIMPDRVDILATFASDGASAEEDAEVAMERARQALKNSGTLSDAAIDADLAVLHVELSLLQRRHHK